MTRGIDPVKGRYHTCAHLRYYNPCNVEEDADKVLEEWDDVCAEFGISYVLISGTCLGFYREGGYIENDNDIDVALICTEVERKVVITALRAVGFYVGSDKECFKREVMLGFKRIPKAPPWTYTDWRKKTFIFDAFDTVARNGREYNVIHPIEAYLEWAFNDWKTPRLRPV